MAKQTIADLGERVAALERQVAELRAGQGGLPSPRVKDWRRTIGRFTGDDGMRQLFQEAMKLREADRAKARRRSPKSERVKA